MDERTKLSNLTVLQNNHNEWLDNIKEYIKDKIIKLINWEIGEIDLNPNIIDTFEKELEKKFGEKIIWQEKAKKVLVKAVIHNLFSIRKKKWPLGVFFFTWPSWVGKTQIARTLADILLWSKDFITKIDCEKYTEAHTINNLFWSSKTYVWYWEATPLNDINLFKHYNTAKKLWTLHEKIKYYQNFSIIVFDEIEKAHPKIHQALLSAMDDWKIKFPTWKEDNSKLNYSNETDLSSSIIIFTSNVWNNKISKKSMWFVQEDNEEETKKDFTHEFEKHFSPEFIWRVDAFVPFDHLNKKDIFDIIKLEIEDLQWNMWKLNWNIKLNIHDNVIQDIVGKSYSKQYWARPSINKFRDTIEADINKIINSWQLEDIFSHNEYKYLYTFIIDVNIEKWEYKYSLKTKKLDNIKKMNNIINKMEEDIKYYFSYDEYTEINDLFEIFDKLNLNGVNWINQKIYNIYLESIPDFDMIHQVDTYEWLELSSKEEKKLFQDIWWRRTIKTIIERKIKIHKWYLDYKSHDFKKLFLEIFEIIEHLNWKIISPAKAKEIIKIIDHVKKDKIK